MFWINCCPILFKVKRTCLLDIQICQVWHTVFDFNKVTGFDAQMFQILALSLAFEVTKNIHIFQGQLGALEDAWVNDLGLASWSWFLLGQWSLIHPWNEFQLSVLIWKCKEHSCLLNPELGLWGIMEVNDYDFSSWSWFGSLSLLWRCQDHSFSFIPALWILMMLEVPDWGLESWFSFGYIGIGIGIGLYSLNNSCGTKGLKMWIGLAPNRWVPKNK